MTFNRIYSNPIKIKEPLVYSIFERFASSKFRSLGCLDFDGGTCAWITPITSRTLAHIKSTKTYQSYHIAIFHGTLNSSNSGIQSAASSSLGHVSIFGDRVNQLRFVHV